MKLYKNIKEFRKAKGLTQAELAKLTGYTTPSMISKIENGEVDLSESKISLFAKILGVDPVDLLGLEDPDTTAGKFDQIYLEHMQALNQQPYITPSEMRLVQAFREHEDVQYAIIKLLELENDPYFQIDDREYPEEND